jgi:hypothetical protein
LGAQTGLALLAAGVSKNDPLIEKLAAKIRRDADRISSSQALSFSILFLDKLGHADDAPLIRTFALRLVHGRLVPSPNAKPGNCGWGQDCPVLTSEEQAQLRKLLCEPTAQDSPPKPAPVPMGTGQKSTNTSYPLLALWVAQRYDLDLRPVLAQAVERFRRCQYSNGGFHQGTIYVGHNGGHLGDEFDLSSSSFLTCDGLIALAMGWELNKPDSAGLGSGPKSKGPEAKPARDPAMTKGFNYIASHFGQSTAAGSGEIGYHGAFVDRKGLIEYHTSWSWACAAQIYDLKTIGRRDWYAWAAKEMVAAQKEDGSFTYAPTHGYPFYGQEDWYGLTSSTSFAVLVLNRARVTPELTAALKGRLDLRQVGEPNEAPVIPSMWKSESMLDKAGPSSTAPAPTGGASAQLAALKERLLGQDVDACRKAAAVLADAGTAGVPALKETLRHHKDKAVRLLAVQTLEKMGPNASGAVLALEVVSRNDSDAAVRHAAAQAVKAIQK